MVRRLAVVRLTQLCVTLVAEVQTEVTLMLGANRGQKMAA